MSQNNTIKPGDLVKYHSGHEHLDELGFEHGQVYEVKLNGDGALLALVKDKGYRGVSLVDSLGQLTDWSDHFARHQCPVVLPRGLVNG